MEQELKEEWLTRTGRLITWYGLFENLNAATFMYKMHSGLKVGQYKHQVALKSCTSDELSEIWPL